MRSPTEWLVFSLCTGALTRVPFSLVRRSGGYGRGGYGGYGRGGYGGYGMGGGYGGTFGSMLMNY